MSNIFEIISQPSKEGSAAAYAVGIKIKIGQQETICPVTKYLPYDSLKREINFFKEELSGILEKVERIEKSSINGGAVCIDDNASPEDIWNALSVTSDEKLFIELFNELDESRRREVADYIFANCNMFTGKGAFFSSRYTQESGLLT